MQERNNNVYMILTNGFDPDIRVYKEAKYLVQKGYKVTILCWDRKCDYKDKEEVVLDGINIKRFFIPSVPGSGMRQLGAFFRFIKSVKKYLKDKNYEYLHCHDLDGMIVGCLSDKKKSKIIFDMHEYYNTGAYSKIYPIVKFILKKFHNKSYKIIHVNNIQIKNIQEKNKEKLIYLPNYPELDKFKNFSQKKSNKLRVIYAGYVRHFLPLSNLSKAVNELDNVEVSIYGIGEEYENIKKIAKECKNVNVFGKYDHNEIVKFYENSDFVYIVYNKGNANDENALPTKFFEALACELPMIVSEDSIMAELVKKYDIGIIVDGTDYISIKNELKKVEENMDILDKMKNNIKNMPDKFSWEEIVKNLNQIYN